MDKQQAQRAVFQLRRKAINSAPNGSAVNKAACGAKCPEEESPDGGDWYDAGPAPPDWANLESEVVDRIRALAVTFSSGKLDAPRELEERLWNDLALPNLRLLSEFCTNVTISDEEVES